MLLLFHIVAKPQMYVEKEQQLHVVYLIHALLVAPDTQEWYAMKLKNVTLTSLQLDAVDSWIPRLRSRMEVQNAGALLTVERNSQKMESHINLSAVAMTERPAQKQATVMQT